MASSVAVKQEVPDLAADGAPNPSKAIDISSNSKSSSDPFADMETNSLINSIISKSKNPRTFDDESPAAKKPRESSPAFPPGIAIKSNNPRSFNHEASVHGGGESTSALPLGFLKPGTLSSVKAMPVTAAVPLAMARVFPGEKNSRTNGQASPSSRGCRQFWKAGDYEGDKDKTINSAFSSGGMDHARIHPKFLHSNATSHKWALGAFAELLDNALDEVCFGASYVNIDMMKNKKNGDVMLVIEDNGGGMTPAKMRQCMSLGYSAKSKMANTIGQYGNGFKTSTMRLGADVIVFSRSVGSDAKSPTQTIGLLSYTFLMGTGKEDIMVPVIDYEKKGEDWNKLIRASSDDWTKNLETIVQWSPFSSEEDLLQQFNLFRGHGTRIVIYNLWENEEGQLELDFDTDPHDIQIRGVNRDEKNIQMAEKYPNSRHFLTYKHSLRSYASILYLVLPAHFRIILRGKDVEHHNIVNDMMENLQKTQTYRPVNLPEGMTRDSNMVAKVTLGFVKDAKSHLDVQGFNVYHKNRLIKPFWRVWNAAGSDGRGVIGVLEANFVEPAHDKQGFERTTVLHRLELRLLGMQKDFWSKNCQTIGYAPRRRSSDFPEREPIVSNEEKSSPTNQNCHVSSGGGSKTNSSKKCKNRSSPVNASSEDGNYHVASHSFGEPQRGPVLDSRIPDTNGEEQVTENLNNERAVMLRTEASIVQRFEEAITDLTYERDRCKSLTNELEKAKEQMQLWEKEYEALIEILVAEKTEREQVEGSLRKCLTDASSTIAQLLDKVKQLEGRPTVSCKVEKNENLTV